MTSALIPLDIQYIGLTKDFITSPYYDDLPLSVSFLSAELQLQHMSHLLDKVFLIFPNYCLGMSFSQFYQNYEFLSFCTTSRLTSDLCRTFSK